MKLNLSGKTALITGGSQGIGRAIALGLAEEGVSVAICARGERELDDASRLIAEKAGGAPVTIAADCTDVAAIKTMVSKVARELGRIDILINCVGRAKSGRFLELTDDDWFQTINLKLMSAVRVTREVLPRMIEQNYGRIVMIGGVFGIQPSPITMPMGVVNAGLFNFTKALAQDVAGHNVLVNALAPGRIDTPLFRQLVEKQMADFKLTEPEAMSRILSEVPLGRAGTSDDIANAVTFLVSDAAGYCTGETITVDGGWVKAI